MPGGNSEYLVTGKENLKIFIDTYILSFQTKQKKLI